MESGHTGLGKHCVVAKTIIIMQQNIEIYMVVNLYNLEQLSSLQRRMAVMELQHSFNPHWSTAHKLIQCTPIFFYLIQLHPHPLHIIQLSLIILFIFLGLIAPQVQKKDFLVTLLTGFL